MDNRMYAPSPTVNASPVPFYLRGVSPGTFDTNYPETSGVVATGIDPDTADLLFTAMANGLITQAQFEQIESGQMPAAQLHALLYGGNSDNQLPEAPIPSSSCGMGWLGQDETGIIYDENGNPINTSLPVDPYNLPSQQPALPGYSTAASQAYYQTIYAGGTPAAAAAAAAAAPQATPAFTDAQSQAMIQTAQAGGTPAQQQAAMAAVPANATPAQIAAAVASVMKTVSTATIGPSPRIMVAPPSSLQTALTQSTLLPSLGIPDSMVYVGIFGLLLALSGGGKR